MIPHERSLVERLKNEPFALVGVNTDPSKDDYREKAKDMGVTWRSAWDGSTSGLLCRQWNVRTFPTVYVLDAKGVLRYTGLRGEALSQAVDTLIQELKSGPPKTTGPEPNPGPREKPDEKPAGSTPR